MSQRIPGTRGSEFPALLDSTARVTILKGGQNPTTGTRRTVRMIEGAGVTLTIADDAANERVDVTIAAAGGGTPAVSVVTETAYGQASAVGAGTNYARQDHTHGTPSLGTTGATAAAGNDARLSDARTPTAHATTHQPGGTDALAVDAAAATGSLRTLGTGAAQAAAGTDSRLSDSRAPSGAASGQLGGTYPSPDVRGLRETAGPTLLTVGAVADGQVLKRVGVTVVGAAVTPTLGAVYGGGESTTATFDLDGTNNFSGFYSRVGLVYTQVRDVKCATYIVRAGVTVLTSQFWIYAETSFVNEGTIRNNGNAGNGNTNGPAVTAAGTLSMLGSAGAGGRVSTGAGGGGGLGGNLVGGYGGNGGAAGSNLGGVPTTGLPSPSWQMGGTAIFRDTNRALSGTSLFGAGGGGGAGAGGVTVNTGTAASGGGGGGASGIRINARSYQNNGTISCTGGAGGAAAVTGDAVAGGGGGGGGGYIGIMADIIVTGTGTATCAGGVGGAGAGTGGNAGATGLAGLVETITPSSVTRS